MFCSRCGALMEWNEQWQCYACCFCGNMNSYLDRDDNIYNEKN